MALATAIILSINKHSELRRQLLYYANKPVHLILADGSSDDWSTGNYGSIGEMTWEYFRISGSKTYLKRLAEASRRVQTEYVFLVDHEECILWSGIKVAIAFLVDNNDHSCAGGRADTTQLSRKRISLVPHYNRKNQFCLLEESALERFQTAFQSKRTRDLTYQVKRSRDLQLFAETVKDVNLVGRSRYIPEYLQFGYFVLLGKYTGQSFPYWIRNGGSTPAMFGDPDLPTRSDYEEMSKLIVEAFEKRSQIKGLKTINLGSSKLTEIMSSKLEQKQKSDVDSSEKGKRIGAFLNSSRRSFTSVVLFAGQILYDFLPRIYQLLQPDGYQTFSVYASKHSNGSREVMQDLLLIEKIWRKFPNGVSDAELKTFSDNVTSRF